MTVSEVAVCGGWNSRIAFRFCSDLLQCIRLSVRARWESNVVLRMSPLSSCFSKSPAPQRLPKFLPNERCCEHFALVAMLHWVRGRRLSATGLGKVVWFFEVKVDE